MVGKGRAPCCDKSKVKRGPWSPNEDLRLITFIQKYGHDNWRALPKLAGLLRCGKSCRLRWINYLRPDVKRGNFTKEEEENIIKLHQTLGNKWSKIASHFSGRTDNEIKNVWNTHLKKRSMLSSKNNDPSGDESNRKSSITTTSSSSSSINSSLSTRKRDSREELIEEESDPKRVCDENELTIRHEKIDQSDDDVEKQVRDKEISPQLAKYPQEQVMISSTTSSNSSYGSNVSSGDMISMELPNLEEEFSMDHTLLFDFKEPCVSDFFCEVNKPNNIDEKAVLLDQTTTLMPLESEFGSDFWDMLNSFETSIFQPNDNIGEVQELENSEPCHTSTFLEKQNLEEIDEKKKWFDYLESKLELEGTTMEINEDQNQVEQLDQTHAFEEITVPEINFSNEINVTPEADPICLDFSPSYDLWDY